MEGILQGIPAMVYGGIGVKVCIVNVGDKLVVYRERDKAYSEYWRKAFLHRDEIHTWEIVNETQQGDETTLIYETQDYETKELSINAYEVK